MVIFFVFMFIFILDLIGVIVIWNFELIYFIVWVESCLMVVWYGCFIEVENL